MIIDSITILGLKCSECPKLIDMGLSVKWAENNIGISNNELETTKYGDYFAWGELNGYTCDPTASKFYIDTNREPGDVPKTEGNEFNMSDYKFGDPPSAYTESGDTLNGSDDIATVLYGERFSIPTPSQWDELFNNCNIELKEVNGVSGLTLKSNITSNEIFLPFIGHVGAGYINNIEYGEYWTNTSELYSGAIKCIFGKATDTNPVQLYTYTCAPNKKFEGLAIRPVYNG